MAAYTKGPGVYAKEVSVPQPITISGSTRTVGIVGTATSDYLVSNAEVVKGAGSTDTITGTTTGQVTSLVGVGSLPGLYDYTLNTDYTISDNVITWLGVNDPTTAATYYVTYYKLKSSTYYDPTLFYDIADVRAQYGSEYNNGAVNQITLGAYLAFTNGASQVLCCQQESGSDVDAEAAIDKLEAETVDILCAPGMTNATLQAYLLAHVNKMSSETEKKERVFLTAPLTLDASITDIQARVTAFASQRVAVVAPGAVEVSLKDATLLTTSDVEVSSNYAACALAGVMSNPSYDEAEPLTRKQLAGIISLSTTKYKESQMNTLAGTGALVLVDESGIIRVRHALTTDQSTTYNGELQVVSIKDTVKKELRTSLRGYIGTKYVVGKTNAILGAAIKSFCEQKVREEIFNEYRSIKVEEDPNNALKALIYFEFKPVVTLTWCDISFAVYSA